MEEQFVLLFESASIVLLLILPHLSSLLETLNCQGVVRRVLVDESRFNQSSDILRRFWREVDLLDDDWCNSRVALLATGIHREDVPKQIFLGCIEEEGRRLELWWWAILPLDWLGCLTFLLLWFGLLRSFFTFLSFSLRFCRWWHQFTEGDSLHLLSGTGRIDLFDDRRLRNLWTLFNFSLEPFPVDWNLVLFSILPLLQCHQGLLLRVAEERILLFFRILPFT